MPIFGHPDMWYVSLSSRKWRLRDVMLVFPLTLAVFRINSSRKSTLDLFFGLFFQYLAQYFLHIGTEKGHF